MMINPMVRRPSRVLIPALLLPALLAACGPSAQTKQQIADLQAASAQKDSLMAEVAADARLMSEINAEIARAQGRPVSAPGEENVAAPVDRDSLLSGIQALSARLDSTQVRLARSESRAKRLSGSAASLRRTLEDLKATVANQKATIVALNEQVNELKTSNMQLTAQNTDLSVANASLSDTLTTMKKQARTVYYVVGTKQDLLSRGIVRETGGSRVLFIFGKRGQTLVPSGDLNPDYFTPVNMNEVTQIMLPDSTHTYRVVTSQDLSALSTPTDDKGRFRAGELRIADPQRFWAHSRFLILVQS